MRRTILSEDPSILGARIREVRERAGYNTLTEPGKAIQERGGSITREHIYYLEHRKGTVSHKKLTMILDACGVTMSDFLGTDLIMREDATILGARIRQIRELAGYRTSGQLWNAIRKRGGNITRQYLYQLEHGKKTASLNKLTMILDACGVTMSDFLGTDLVIGPRGDTNILERKFVTMLTTIRKLNPSLARVVGGAIISAHAEAIKLSKQQVSKGVGSEGGNRQTQRRTYQRGPGTAKGQTSN